MGGGASAVLQDNMNEAYLREYAGERFDQVKYNALHNESGEVSKKILLDTVADGIPREVYLTYTSYCPSGYMSLYQYVTMIRNAKFLNKKCNRQTAESLFHGARFAAGDMDMHINYYTFITDILPHLASQRDTTPDQLFDKLAFIELGTGEDVAPGIIDNKQKSLMESLCQATAAVATHSGKIAPSVVSEPEPVAKEKEKEHAATLMQKKARARTAKRQVQEMREIKNIRGEKKTPRYPKVDAPPDAMATAFKKPLHIPRLHSTGDLNELDTLDALGAEIILEEVFLSYCVVTGEADASNCKKMFRENNLLSKKFTTNDVDALFRKAVAKIMASEEDNPLREGVIFEKRMTYPVFRAEVVGAASHKRGLTLDQFLELLKTNYIALKRVKCSDRDHGLAPDNDV